MLNPTSLPFRWKIYYLQSNHLEALDFVLRLRFTFPWSYYPLTFLKKNDNKATIVIWHKSKGQYWNSSTKYFSALGVNLSGNISQNDDFYSFLYIRVTCLSWLAALEYILFSKHQPCNYTAFLPLTSKQHLKSTS